MLQDAPALVTALDVFTICTFTILVAGDSCLETFAILFKTFAFFAIAAFGVTLLSTVLAHNICVRICGF